MLVVDDNQDAAETLADLLSFSGFDARWATSGRGARELFSTFRPDALVVDYLIPDTSCESLIAEARGTAPSLRVLVWTGSQNDFTRLRSNPAVSAVVLKPAGAQEIVTWLRTL